MIPFRLSALFLFLSGAAGLIYQVSWVRLLSLSIGSTSVSTGIILATFFLGLALGSFLVTRFPRHLLNGIGFYLFVEGVIAGSALLLLPLLLHLDQLVAAWPQMATLLPLKLLLVMTALAVPSIAIGMTYPLMVGLMARDPEKLGDHLGWLYAVNTAGAVAGAVGAGFLLIPRWGLDGAIYFGCLLNAVVVVTGWIFRKGFLRSSCVPAAEPCQGPLLSAAGRWKILTVLFLTGVVALACEVAWSKYLIIFVHATIHGFSALLAIFLLGIAAGSWFIRPRLDTLAHPLRWVVALLCVLALSLVVTRSALQYLPAIHATFVGGCGIVVETLSKYGLILLVLFPSTAVLGALFTLNVHLYCGTVTKVGSRAGIAYAVNTAGGVAGSLLAGLWLIPEYGSNATLSLAIGVTVLLPLLLLGQVMPGMRRLLVITSMTLAVLGIFYLPHLDFRQMITASRYHFDPEKGMDRPPEFRFLREGRSGVVSVTTYDGKRFRLQNNTLPEAVVTPPDPFPWLSETLLGLIPYLLGDHSERLFVVGLGAGTTLSAAAMTPASSITVVELEPAVVPATRAIFSEGIAALGDPRVRLVFDDARHHLLVNGESYDAIITQPSHPWLAGSGNLFTKEYFALVAAHLNEGGVSVQWLNLFHMDTTTLRSILKAYFEIFPHGMTFVVYHERSLILVGSKGPIPFDYARLRNRLDQRDLQRLLRRWGANTPRQLHQYVSLSRSQALRFAGDVAANRDTTLVPEMRLAWFDGQPEEEQRIAELFLQRFRVNIGNPSAVGR